MEFKLKSPCVEWTGAMTPEGYGRRRVSGKIWMAHRYAYQMFYGDLDDGLVIDHLCFNRACVEPTHLRQITREENSARHNPDCRCRKHLSIWAGNECPNGHDLTTPGARMPPEDFQEYGRCTACHEERKAAARHRKRELADKERPDRKRRRSAWAHGTVAGARYCRCEECREAKNSYCREWRAKVRAAGQTPT